MTLPPLIFDPCRRDLKLKRAHRKNATDADFLWRNAAQEMADRLAVTNREFAHAVMIDDFGKRDAGPFERCHNLGPLRFDPLRRVQIDRAVQDGAPMKMEILGDQTRDCDLILSCFGLHWVNDLPGVLHQIRQALKPDGLFMAVLPGQGTLHELNDCILQAEMERLGGAGMRTDPFAEIRQIGDLLTRAGFTLPVVDGDEVVVRYRSFEGLISDLRSMAATSSLVTNRTPMGAGTLDAIKRLYRQNYCDDDGKLRATFRFIFLSGWAPHESQQKPLERGSAQVSLKRILEP